MREYATVFFRFKNLLDGLKAEGNMPRQLEALNEVCEILCMGNEESLQGVKPLDTDKYMFTSIP
jgi:hypothetical protein